MKTILSLITALSLSACIADPSDDLGHSRDLRVDDTHGDMYDGLDQDQDAPSIRDATHGELDEAIDNSDETDVTDQPTNLAVAR
ncbi:MAG TPA: hypothetical protein VGM90_35130 [Kofleriaceae bacterium]|jgi:hypothetical protein